MGLISHGRGAYGFTFLDNVKQGTNVTIEVMYQALLDMESHNEAIPDVLFLQMDNTAKQCKNQYMWGFLGYLAMRKIFRKVVVSFLPVGHTHEDIDLIQNLTFLISL